MMSLKGHKGFTLIEVMVGVAIIAIISLLLWQSSSVMINAKMRYEVQDERFHEVLLALTRMTDDLSMAFLYQSEDHLGGGGIEPQRIIQFLGKDNGDQDEIHFASMSHVRYMKDSKECEQTEISYFLKKSEEKEGGVFSLIKRIQSPPDRDPKKGGTEYLVLEDVLALKLQFYNENKQEWKREWDSSSVDFNKSLPKAVEIIIEINDPVDPEGEKKSFITTALLEMAPGPNDF